MKTLIFIIVLGLFGILGCQNPTNQEILASDTMEKQAQELETATFAGGCFWCTEAVFQRVRGVEKVISGYSGGTVDVQTGVEVSVATVPSAAPAASGEPWRSAARSTRPVSSTGAAPTVDLSLGSHTIALIVRDGQADSEPDEVVVAVVDVLISHKREVRTLVRSLLRWKSQKSI